MNGWCPGETMSKQILYIDGDSWLMVQNVLQFLDENYGTFKDFIIVNASVMANSNYDIVTRTIHNIRALRELGISPWVLVGLTEVGRGYSREAQWCLPQGDTVDINEYLKKLLLHTHTMLEQELQDCPHYICSAWTTGVTDTKGIIEFAVDDYNTYPVCYSLLKQNIQWYVDRKDLFRLTKDSISTLIENSHEYQMRCASSGLLDNDIHLKDHASIRMTWKPNSTTDAYKRFFEHAIDHMSRSSSG